MCRAIREMMEDSRMEGIVEGEARGEARGEAKGSASQIIEIIENIMSELQCPLEKACRYAGKYKFFSIRIFNVNKSGNCAILVFNGLISARGRRFR